jgi:hypothetical protein
MDFKITEVKTQPIKIKYQSTINSNIAFKDYDLFDHASPKESVYNFKSEHFQYSIDFPNGNTPPDNDLLKKLYYNLLEFKNN